MRTRAEERAFRESTRRWAVRLGCTIEWDATLKLWWVYGPDAVYGDAALPDVRDDPRDGDHAALDYDDVGYLLEVYAEDLYLGGRGLTSADSKAVRDRGPPMLTDCVSHPGDDGLFSIMLDWLTDHGLGAIVDRHR